MGIQFYSFTALKKYILFLVHQARLRWLISKLFVMQLTSKTGALQHMSCYSLLKQLVKVHFKHIFHTWNWCEIWFLYISTPKAKSDCCACAALNLHGNLTSTPTTHYLSQIKNGGRMRKPTSAGTWLSIFRHFSWSHWQFSPHVIFPLRHLHCLLLQRPLHAH